MQNQQVHIVLCWNFTEKQVNNHHHHLRFMAVFQTLLGSPYAVLWPSILLCHIRPSADRCLPSTTTLTLAFTRSASPFHSTSPCHLSLHLLITFPITSTPRRFLSSVLGCLSFRETPHIHLIILISVLSIFGSSSALVPMSRTHTTSSNRVG